MKVQVSWKSSPTGRLESAAGYNQPQRLVKCGMESAVTRIEPLELESGAVYSQPLNGISLTSYLAAGN